MRCATTQTNGSKFREIFKKVSLANHATLAVFGIEIYESVLLYTHIWSDTYKLLKVTK